MQKAKYFLSGILCTLMLLALTEPALGALVGKTIQVYTGVNVYVDDVKIEPQDEHGNPVEVFSYNGTTYLPVRALSKAFGKPIQWEGKTLSVYVGKHSSDKPAVWLENLDYFDSDGYKHLEKTKREMKDNLGNTYEHSLYSYNDSYTVYKLNGQYSAISGIFFKTYNYRSDDRTASLKIYSQEYFETFWKRNYSDQSWLPLNKGSSFTAKRGITTALTEMGYEETLLVDGKTIKSTLWFYGELDPCNLGNNTH